MLIARFYHTLPEPPGLPPASPATVLEKQVSPIPKTEHKKSLKDFFLLLFQFSTYSAYYWSWLILLYLNTFSATLVLPPRLPLAQPLLPPFPFPQEPLFPLPHPAPIYGHPFRLPLMVSAVQCVSKLKANEKNSFSGSPASSSNFCPASLPNYL